MLATDQDNIMIQGLQVRISNCIVSKKKNSADSDEMLNSAASYHQCLDFL